MRILIARYCWSFLSQTSTRLVCSVKLFQTSSSLSSAKLSKLSSKHGTTQLKQNLNWFSSTVSDSEALIHLAYVQHMWQSKFVVILEGLTRWRIELR